MARVEGAGEKELEWLFDYLVIRTPQFRYDHETKRSVYDGLAAEHLFDLHTETFPAGFAYQVARVARERGFTVEPVDGRTCPALPDVNADLKWLRGYQYRCVLKALSRSRGLIHGATGMGKTECIAALVRSLPSLPFLILVHRSNLMHDIKARLDKRADEHGLDREDIGFYGDGHKELKCRVTVATFQSLSKNLRNPAVKAMLARAEALIVDEAHTAAAATFARIIERCDKAYYRWGVSGTPLDRSDKRSNYTIGLLGPVIERVSAKELIDEGVLAKPEVRIVRYDTDSIYSNNWHEVRTRGIVQNRGRNQAVLNAVRRAHKPCLLFVDILEHGEFLTKTLQKGGINAEFIWGEKKTEQRQAAIEKLARGDLDVVCCSSVFNEGIDIPELAAVVLGGGGKSVIATLQRIGRGMRKTATKDTFQIWDFEDTHHRMLEDHLEARKKSYRREQHEIVVDTEVLRLVEEHEAQKRARRRPAPQLALVKGGTAAYAR